MARTVVDVNGTVAEVRAMLKTAKREKMFMKKHKITRMVKDGIEYVVRKRRRKPGRRRAASKAEPRVKKVKRQVRKRVVRPHAAGPETASE